MHFNKSRALCNNSNKENDSIKILLSKRSWIKRLVISQISVMNLRKSSNKIFTTNKSEDYN